MSTQTSDGPAPARAAVRDQLDRVTDPELDRSIVALEYVDAIEIDGGHVSVDLTLPTAWCSPAFAWMMAVDARDEIESLPAVEEARITLHEHMHETEINRGVNEDLSFAEAFPDADGDVAAVRAELDDKARVARQYDAVEALLEAGLDARAIVDVRLRDLEYVDGADSVSIYVRDSSFAVTVPEAPLERYLEKTREIGLVSAPADRLFRTPEGEPIDPDSFDLVHRRGRLAQVNMSSQGGICDGLREAREGRLEETAGD
ncbi:iron-sulfur cluster assembly protein [Natrinema hispanicum]|uniref:Metal-sulfur cluster biosynthetic enzyme n=1 Tax=Natrinema hispanicum TaxID=392421 RepID=A0A1I0E356_9EURY|nr:iron-sulfur cluster assembly protein [Natrinema hispanicum]SDC70492.1 Metal-sulfur cluster biosynthetic enzyme [Natrinema hispanicum]SET38617.1 Metal-sulfur cluster biosynthetic enzyme [Natrinema hispanicum]